MDSRSNGNRRVKHSVLRSAEEGDLVTEIQQRKAAAISRKNAEIARKYTDIQKRVDARAAAASKMKMGQLLARSKASSSILSWPAAEQLVVDAELPLFADIEEERRDRKW